MNLTDEMHTFILNWGEKLSHWGLNRTEAQIYTLLFLSPKALTMEEIATMLNVARSNVTNSLKELQSWKIVKLVSIAEDRRKHFVCLKDVWKVFHEVLREQKRREIDPMIELLQETQKQFIETPTPENEIAKNKIDEMIDFFETTMSLYNHLESMSPETLKKYVQMASKAENFLKKVTFKK